MLINIDDMVNYGPDAILIIDVVDIIDLYYSNIAEIDKLLNYRYILIIGENYDHTINSFMGWGHINLNFSMDNQLYKIIKNSYRVTYQNNKTLHVLQTIKNSNDIIFFPIDGFMDEYVIQDSTIHKDIDVFFYGYPFYERRVKILDDLSKLPINIVVRRDIFDIEELKHFINRSKIIFHCNSIDNCYHIPYAKIAKLLSNNKIVVVEETEELLESELCHYLYPFDIKKHRINNDLLIPAYIDIVNNILNNYEYEQKILADKNPQTLMKTKYNFTDNVLSLIIK